MNLIGCTDARAEMLSAEPAELRGVGDSPLATHIRSCSDCRSIARMLTDRHEALATAVHTVVDGRMAVTRRSIRRRVMTAAPLAAAAVLALILLGRGLPGTRDALPPLLMPEPHVPETPQVNAAAGGAVAVMRTSNPAITIVWQLEIPQ